MKSIHLNSTDQFEKRYGGHTKQSQYTNLAAIEAVYTSTLTSALLYDNDKVSEDPT